MKLSQQQIVLRRLEEKKEVSRNWAIREQYITRLGAIICDLKIKGYEFKTETRGQTPERQGDFVYILIKDPTGLDENVWSKETVAQRRDDYHNPKLI